MSTAPATKADLEAAMTASATALDQTEEALRGEIHSSEKRILEAIDRLEKFYDVDRRLKIVEKRLKIAA